MVAQAINSSPTEESLNTEFAFLHDGRVSQDDTSIIESGPDGL